MKGLSSKPSPLDLQVIEGDSFTVAKMMIDAYRCEPCVLNMASDRHVGGGVTRGARAQEEELCRRSTLYPCLKVLEKHYPWHPLTTSVFTPKVGVFRDEDYSWLPKPFYVNVISSAALRRPEHTKDGRYKSKDYQDMKARATAFLSVCVRHNQRHLVLSAWGCGAFGNPPKGVAHLFKTLLNGPFAGYFDAVWFGIIDNSRTRNFETFASILTP